MKKIKTSLLTLGATLIAASTLFAATAYMDPVGAVVVTCFGGAPTDTRISIPFQQSPIFVGAAVSDGTAGSIDLTGAGLTPGLTGDYVLVRDGALEGELLDITSNTADIVDVATSAVGLSAGDTVTISKHWTTLDIVGDFADQDALLLYDSTAPGINKGASDIYTNWSGTWYNTIFQVVDDYPLYPGESFIVRNNGATTDLVLAGNVPMNDTRLYVMNVGTQQDNYIGMMCPVGIGVVASGLTLADQDAILVPDNINPGINKGAIDIYTNWSGTWYNTIFQVVDNDPLEPGVGYIFRKGGAGTDSVTGTVPYNP